MFKEWFIASRPWSFTAAIIPIALGTVLAAYQGYFNMVLFILTLLGGIALQAGTNLINTYGDYEKGVDTLESAVNCPHLVKKVFKPQDMKIVGTLVFVFASLIGLYLIYQRGLPIFILGIIGILGGYCYTAGPLPFKYLGLGTVFVFFLMGPLMVIGAYYVQTGLFSWSAFLISIPISLLVSGILHANDLRDVNCDKKASIKTLALIIGEKAGYNLYFLINIAAFLSIFILFLMNIIPLTSFITLLLIPNLYKLLKNAELSRKGNLDCLKMMEMKAANFHFQFGMLFTVGLFLDIII